MLLDRRRWAVIYSLKGKTEARGITGGRTESESRDSPLASGLLVLAGPAIFDVSAVHGDQESLPKRRLLPSSIKTEGRAERGREYKEREQRSRKKSHNGRKPQSVEIKMFCLHF